MNRKRNLLVYVLLIAVFGFVIYFVATRGHTLQPPSRVGNSTIHEISGSEKTSGQQIRDVLHQNIRHSLPILLLQFIVIILFARCFGFLFKKMGQPAVIGEIAAGIFLGPSVLGWLFPGVAQFLFPVQSFENLQFLSQIGLILFMFVIGMELDAEVVRKQALEAVIISHASIIIPYAFGVLLSYFLYTQFANPEIPFLAFALFMGIAMSITAFPVLARIIQERGMSGTRLGTLALTCAAAGDVTGWCILPIIIAIVKAGSSANVLFTVGLVIIYALMMFFLVRPALKKVHQVAGGKSNNRTLMAIIFIVLLLSAYATESLGIHALFGAFIAGLVMPQDKHFREIVSGKIEDISIVLLLPLFFVITGLRTQVALLNDSTLWAAFGWILLVAVMGKFGGSTLAARVVGQNWKDSLSIGALMNTRGLMELVVLNIGYDLGILSTEIFSMMVIMALLTTFMTNPALNMIERLIPAEKYFANAKRP
ncbi:MAG: cation:proton antiporter [Chitinophagales bacterium]